MKLAMRPIAASLILHVLLGILLWFFANPHTLPDPPPVMQAMLMSAPPTAVSRPAVASTPAAVAPQPPAAALKPAPEPAKPKAEPKPTPKTEPKPAPKAEPKPVVPPKPTAAPSEPKKPVKPKIDEQRIDDEIARAEAEAERLTAEADARKRKRDAELRQQALAQQLKEEADAMAASAAADARARQMAAQIQEFTLAINKKIKSQWRRPANVNGKLVAGVRITVFPGGEVASVLITRSSGNPAFDASVKEAVERASPLPVPSDALLFRENFRVFGLNYTTEE